MWYVLMCNTIITPLRNSLASTHLHSTKGPPQDKDHWLSIRSRAICQRVHQALHIRLASLLLGAPCLKPHSSDCRFGYTCVLVSPRYHYIWFLNSITYSQWSIVYHKTCYIKTIVIGYSFDTMWMCHYVISMAMGRVIDIACSLSMSSCQFHEPT